MFRHYRRIAFLFAVASELTPVARRLKLTGAAPRFTRPYPARSGTYAGRELLLLAGGMGRRCGERAARELAQCWRPDLLIVTGVAGALAPGLGIGDLVMPAAVETETEWLLPTAAPPPSASGSLLSLDRVLVTPEEKARVYAASPNRTPYGPRLAVEMETAGAVVAATEAGVPWLAVRAISDTSDEGLPLDFNRLRDADGDLSTSRIARTALTRPHAIPGLMRLGRNTTAAARALAEFFARELEAR